MFAVKGWSVSADKLKTETATDVATGNGTNKSKKRKRPSGAGDVNAANVGEMWDKVIEKKEPAKAEGKDTTTKAGKRAAARERKRAKRLKAEQDGEDVKGDVDEDDAAGDADTPVKTNGKVATASPKTDETEGGPKKQKKDKMQKKSQSERNSGTSEADQAKSAPAPPKASVPAPPPAQLTLTPLQASMRSKLVSARFRHLNEALYTRPSADAMSLFAESPDMFAQYHEGFRRQVGVWPENPVDGYIRDLRTRGKVKPQFGAGKGGPPRYAKGEVPLPRTEGICTVADLGCGDGKLGATLLGVDVSDSSAQEASSDAATKAEEKDAKRQKRLDKKLGLAVLSFDLQSPAPHVKLADIAALPLRDGAVDVAIFCLALMGTNWLDFIDEAYRILRWKGELWVAEIKSRFAHPASSKSKNVVSHSVGKQRKLAAATPQLSKKKGGKRGGEDEDQDADLAVVVDGDEDRRQDTDVSAFVDALRKRGFVLSQDGAEGYPAVDMGNKMFVKMRFVKAATPVKGKGAAAAAAGAGGRGAPRKKWIDAGGDEDEGADESKILKPCVYKIR